MARQASNNLNKFKGLEDSPAIQGIERIYEANEEAHQKRVAEALEQQQNGQASQRRTLCHRLMPLRILSSFCIICPYFDSRTCTSEKNWQEDSERHHYLCADELLHADITDEDGDGCSY